MIRIPPRSPEEADLEKAMQGPPPAPGPTLDNLLYQWLSTTSTHLPGQANSLRFPFLKWALHGRAKLVVTHLRSLKDPRAREVVNEIERIAGFPFPPENERARAQAMDLWAWLKKELKGKVE